MKLQISLTETGNPGSKLIIYFPPDTVIISPICLKLLFGGQLCWAQDRGHIVWADIQEGCTFDELQKARAYDISGIFDDYEVLWPVSYLGDAIVDYLHNEQTFHVNDRFKAWCDFAMLPKCMPSTRSGGRSRRKKSKLSITTVPITYKLLISIGWNMHLNCSRSSAIITKSHKFFYPDHAGIEACMAKLEL